MASSKKAIFAGGCFCCMQPPFDALPGVLSTTVGYTGGATPNPAYEDVCAGGTGHAEAVEIIYDPDKISYSTLLDAFWRQIDPTTLNCQFADGGTQYRTAVYYHDDEQCAAAEKSKKALGESGRFEKPIVTEISAAMPFYPAEDYHQKYYQKSAAHYKRYRAGSGRQDFIERVWDER